MSNKTSAAGQSGSSAPAADAVAYRLALLHRVQLADDFGALDAELSLLKPKIKQHEKLRKEIQAQFDKAPPEEINIVEGTRFTVIVGARKLERKITNMPGLYRFIGAKLFLEICSIALEKIDALVKPEKQKLFLVQTQTGSRPVESAPNTKAA